MESEGQFRSNRVTPVSSGEIEFYNPPSVLPAHAESTEVVRYDPDDQYDEYEENDNYDRRRPEPRAERREHQDYQRDDREPGQLRQRLGVAVALAAIFMCGKIAIEDNSQTISEARKKLGDVIATDNPCNKEELDGRRNGFASWLAGVEICRGEEALKNAGYGDDSSNPAPTTTSENIPNQSMGSSTTPSAVSILALGEHTVA